MFKSVGDVLFKSYNFRATVSIFVDNTGDPNAERYKQSKFVNITKSKNPNEAPSVYFDTFSKSLIGFCALEPPNNDKKYASQGANTVYFSQKSFFEIELAINICIEWMRSKAFKYLFLTNSDGEVTGLGAAPPYNPIVYKSQSEFIRFFPAVVKDINGVKYEGVAIKSHRGALAQFTCSEFLVLAAALKSYLSNSYGNNLQLLNCALAMAQFKTSV